ncbi:MAG: AAA family ATPase [Gemmataceae bacterium]|nr:AAA family ATPase [Gemmataceae bacterium]MDW8243741.1 AAA family ATPase [Thermogemmata sp.]
MSSVWANLDDELRAAEEARELGQRILDECNKVIVGQRDVLELLLIALLGQGHALLVGVPGLAKTLMIRTLAECMNLSFNRIQFTPDLMPSDITGTEILQEDRSSGQRIFQFVHGPIFAQVLLADEINRTPPKTQAALLEAMQERQVTVAGQRHKLPQPFFVLATQNPIEQEGTYPLPEAQQDRFMFTIVVDYPSEEDEYRVIALTTGSERPRVEQVISGEQIGWMQALVRRVPVAEYVMRYALRLTRWTRPQPSEGGQERTTTEVPDYVRQYVTWGAGPRAGQNLILAAKGRALLHGRHHVAIEDIQAVALPVLRHRIITNYAAKADNITPDDLIRRLLHDVPARLP